MAAGRAKTIHGRTGKPVCIGRPNRQIIWCDLYDNVPYLCKDPLNLDAAWLYDYPGNRPYIDYEKTRAHPDNAGCKGKKFNRWLFKEYSPTPMDIVFSEKEEQEVKEHKADRFIVLEPNIKANAPPLKQWPWENWETVAHYLAREYPHMKLVQLTQPGKETRILPHAIDVKCDLRGAACWMAGANLYVGHEGMMHHLAAALHIPAVVMFGIFISPSITGYSGQRSIHKHTPYLGWRQDHEAGRAVMENMGCTDTIKQIRRSLDP